MISLHRPAPPKARTAKQQLLGALISDFKKGIHGPMSSAHVGLQDPKKDSLLQNFSELLLG